MVALFRRRIELTSHLNPYVLSGLSLLPLPSSRQCCSYPEDHLVAAPIPASQRSSNRQPGNFSYRSDHADSTDRSLRRHTDSRHRQVAPTRVRRTDDHFSDAIRGLNSAQLPTHTSNNIDFFLEASFGLAKRFGQGAFFI